MRNRRRHAALTTLCTAAVLATGLTAVAGAPAASAARGDQSTFPIGGNIKRAYAITVVGDRLWATATQDKALVSITTAGAATVHRLPDSFPAGDSLGIAGGAGGRIWFTEFDNAAVSSVDSNGGDLKRRTILKGSKPVGIVAGRDGSMWYAVQTPDRISRLDKDNKVSDFIFGEKIGMSGIASIGADGVVFTGFDKDVIGTVSPAGKKTLIPLPSADPTDVAVGPDGTFWVARQGSGLVRVSPSGAATPVTTKGGGIPLAVTMAGDGSAWWVGTGGRIGRAAPDGGSVEEFTLTFQPRDLVAGPDGNLWVTADQSPVIMRVLSGIVPEVTNLPVLTAPAGAAGPGTVLTATDGSWRYQPTSLARQWQRCTSATDGCSDIPGATAATYTVTDADLGGFLRVNVTASNLNGASKPASSAGQQTAPKPATPGAPTTPTGPAPVAGAGSVLLAPGVTAKATAPTRVTRGPKRTYAVTFTSPTPRGSVRISLVNAGGAEVLVIADGAAVKATKKSAYVRKKARVPRSVPKGAYTIVSVFTPSAKQAGTYPSATITRPLTVR